MKNKGYKIIKIDSQKTLSIRYQAMWPNKPIDYVKLENDIQGLHFGLFIQDKIISVISLFEENSNIQFRKFATLNTFQGQGYGTILLNYILEYAEKNEYKKVWCNARVNKSAFYKRFGLKETNSYFDKGGIKYVIMEKRNYEDYKLSRK
ncbi:GNAT family N-acetyltransferase [Flavivirga algicola]|uniref:GNAT family N-acetyltransferase n=1 Tax=Flavivirga algicola TaxID=2729136 RepID=A0ABX1RUT8_9FLAO|nr:GNAT family N-acetyltransferase [Flavivirga algicola]NMH87311.1 GNAT family N-acetyltransferase [Flavivirga algicola]